MRGRLSRVVAAGAVIVAACMHAAPALAVDASAAAISISVSDNVGGVAELGSTVRFSYTITNSGDETITALAVTDTLAGHLGDVAELAPGAQVGFSADVVIDGPAQSGMGTCSAQGFSAGGPVSASFDYSIDVFIGDSFPDFSVRKQFLGFDGARDTLLRYRVTVTNRSGEDVKEGFRIRVADDYDESMVRVVDDGGGDEADGKLIWDVPAPPLSDGPLVIEYLLEVRTGSAGVVSNTVTISTDGDLVPENDTDSVSVRVPPAGGSSEEPASEDGPASGDGSEDFLPFTGTPSALIPPIAWVFGLAGFALRRAAAQSVSSR